MADSPNTTTVPAIHRAAIEDEIERLIGILDAFDGDCEDEGAQCEDEGYSCDDEVDYRSW